MARCKRKISKSKRKNKGCKGCQYLRKVLFYGQYRWMCTY